MKKLVSIFVLLVLSACGRAQDVDALLESETSSVKGDSLLRVECLSTRDYSRGIELRTRLTLKIQNNSVSLNKLETFITANQLSSNSMTITGQVNNVFDGTVVKSTHATVLLASTSMSQTDFKGKKIESKPRYVLIEYSQGKIKVTDPNTKVLLSQGNCRTAEAVGLIATR